MKKILLTGLATGLFMLGIVGGVNAIPLNDLFAGGTYQFDSLKLTNWSLIKNINVNTYNIDIGTGYYNNEFGVLTQHHELLVKNSQQEKSKTKTLSFDFLVTGIGVDITKVKGELGYRMIQGYSRDSPWMTGSIAIGTTQGSNDLGYSTDIYSLNQNTNTNWITLSGGRNQIWMRTTIKLNSSSLGDNSYAEAGYMMSKGYGAAFRNEFGTQPATAPVPEPATVLLFGSGLAGLASIMRRKKKST